MRRTGRRSIPLRHNRTFEPGLYQHRSDTINLNTEYVGDHPSPVAVGISLRRKFVTGTILFPN